MSTILDVTAYQKINRCKFNYSCSKMGSCMRRPNLAAVELSTEITEQPKNMLTNNQQSPSFDALLRLLMVLNCLKVKVSCHPHPRNFCIGKGFPL
jgi:mannose-6-phosphate isomerase class I